MLNATLNADATLVTDINVADFIADMKKVGLKFYMHEDFAALVSTAKFHATAENDSTTAKWAAMTTTDNSTSAALARAVGRQSLAGYTNENYTILMQDDWFIRQSIIDAGLMLEAPMIVHDCTVTAAMNKMKTLKELAQC